MARLLTNKDYSRQIQSDNLLQVVTNDYSVLYAAEQSAQQEMVSYLTQRYRTDQIFTDTTTFATSSTYYGKSLVEYTEPEFDITIDYNTTERVSYEGKIYENTGGPAGVTPDYSTDWNYITEDKSLYYAKTNKTEWSILTTYTIGQQVWFDNYVYTALSENIGKIPSEEPQIWSVGSKYSFSNILPTNTSYWIKGDNRNQLIVMYLIDITLYHLHSRINPRNIPELRMVRYDGMNATQNGGSIAWLKRVANGDINADLPKILPTQGLSIEWGSETKSRNNY